MRFHSKWQINHSSFLAGKEVICAGCLGIRQGTFNVVDRLGAPTEELGYSETGVHLVRHLFPTL